MTRLCSARPTISTCSTQTGRRMVRSRRPDRDQRHAAIEYTDAVRKERGELLRPERVEHVVERDAAASRAPGGSQCTNGSSVCTSSGNQRFGVVTNTRRETRQSSCTNCRCPSRPPATCSTTAFEKPTSNSPSANGSSRPSARTARTRGKRGFEDVELGATDGRHLLGPRIERLEEVVARAAAERRIVTPTSTTVDAGPGASSSRKSRSFRSRLRSETRDAARCSTAQP